MLGTLPPPTKAVESLPSAACHALGRMLSRMPSLQNEMVPPVELLYDGTESTEEFCKYGEGDARLLVELGGLQPHHRVLDMGCGIGQKARPLTQYLAGEGRYEGLDIMADQVAWCQENITTRYPSFRFQVADIHSQAYNPGGSLEAVEYRFPFGDGEFDFAFLTSVFTHLLPPELEHYMEELARVVKPGGRTFITYFLYNDRVLKFMQAGKPLYNFQYPHSSGICRHVDKEMPEWATAYEDAYIRRVYRNTGFAIVEPIYNGYWSGRNDYLSVKMPGEKVLIPYSQDIVVAVRK